MLSGGQQVRFWLDQRRQQELAGLFEPAFNAWLYAEENSGYWLASDNLGLELTGAQAVLLKREFVTAVAVLSSPAAAAAKKPIGFRE